MEEYRLKRPKYIKRRKRVGRGNSSGHGTSCCTGHDGQMGRSGKQKRPWFEGGQMPLQRRVPKRGFRNFTRIEYQVVNLSQIERLDVSEIEPSAMKKIGIIASEVRPVKILGNGDITKPVRVTADAFSRRAADKIKKAGGEVTTRQGALPHAIEA